MLLKILEGKSILVTSNLDHWKNPPNVNEKVGEKEIPVSKPENKGPDVRAEHDDNPVHDDHTREEAKEQEPEPDKNIDFLVNCKTISQRKTRNCCNVRIPMLSGRMHRASCFSMLPEVPNLWKVHFVILQHREW